MHELSSLTRGIASCPVGEHDVRLKILADALEEGGLCWEARMYRELVRCPEGRFTMGSPPEEAGRQDDEGPVSVQLTQGFWLAKYPVTQEDYEIFTHKTPSVFAQSRTHYDQRTGRGLDTVRFPVDSVSWNDAKQFCERLTEHFADQNALPEGYVWDLPTEARWEYACRGGTVTATAFGDALEPNQANFRYVNRGQRSLQRTTEVGSFPPNAFGLYDMHGNVGEWCEDGYAAALPGGVDPAVTASYAQHPYGFEPDRVVRGGSWDDRAPMCRSASRQYLRPETVDIRIGFRIALVPGEA